MFKKDEEGVDWFGASNIGEEEVLGEVSGWVLKYSVLLSTHQRDSIEDTVGE